MAAPNIVDLPPCRPGVTAIHSRAMNAFRAHWRTHGTTPPQKLVLTPNQAEDLYLCRLYGCVAMPGVKPSKTEFNGRPVELSDATVGMLVAHDGMEMPLADFDQLAPA